MYFHSEGASLLLAAVKEEKPFLTISAYQLKELQNKLSAVFFIA